MCGIVGLLPFKGMKFSVKACRSEFETLLISSVMRGDDATGMYVGLENPFILKSDAPSPRFVNLPQYKEMWDKVAEYGKPVPMFGHTRKGTVGSADDNDNNHPILIGRFVAIHNGSMTNRPSPDNIPGTVDSRYFPWKLSEEKWQSGDHRKLKSILSGINGTFAFCWVSLNEPNVFYLIRDKNDARDVYYHHEEGQYFRFTQMWESGLTKLEPNTLVTINTDTGNVEFKKYNFNSIPEELINFILGVDVKKAKSPDEAKELIAQSVEEEYDGSISITTVPSHGGRAYGSNWGRPRRDNYEEHFGGY